MKSVYILLSRSGTVYSHIVHFVTGGSYTHASLALGPGAARIYSFSRKYARMPLPSPLVREDVPGSYMAGHPDIPCALYRLAVTDEQYDKITQKVEDMLCDGVKYRYSLLGSALCALDIAHERSYHYFCSQFVASVLAESGALSLPKQASLMRPADFQRVRGLELVYTGPVGGAPGTEDIFEGREACGLPGKAGAF